MLTCFSKIPERIVYTRFQKYVFENIILYPKQFGFQVGYSAGYAIIQLDDQIFEAFENNLYTLGMFTDLPKNPERVDHMILLKKLELYGIRGNKHNWIKSYLSNRKHYIEIDHTTKTSLEQVKRGVPPRINITKKVRTKM